MLLGGQRFTVPADLTVRRDVPALEPVMAVPENESSAAGVGLDDHGCLLDSVLRRIVSSGTISAISCDASRRFDRVASQAASMSGRAGAPCSNAV